MKKAVKNILNKLPYIKTLKESVDIQEDIQQVITIPQFPNMKMLRSI